MTNVLSYKGLLGSVTYSHEDGVLYGRILGTDDLIDYSGESVQSLNEAFREAVEDYLDFCKRYGKKPPKACKGTVHVAPVYQVQAMEMSQVSGRSVEDIVGDAIANQYINFRYPVSSRIRVRQKQTA